MRSNRIPSREAISVDKVGKITLLHVNVAQSEPGGTRPVKAYITSLHGEPVSRIQMMNAVPVPSGRVC
jgi:hypothetical protein